MQPKIVGDIAFSLEFVSNNLPTLWLSVRKMVQWGWMCSVWVRSAHITGKCRFLLCMLIYASLAFCSALDNTRYVQVSTSLRSWSRDLICGESLCYSSSSQNIFRRLLLVGLTVALQRHMYFLLHVWDLIDPLLLQELTQDRGLIPSFYSVWSGWMIHHEYSTDPVLQSFSSNWRST